MIGRGHGASEPDDLRDALVAETHDLRNGLHRQSIVIGRSDGFVPLMAEVFGSSIEGGFAPHVVLGEGL